VSSECTPGHAKCITEILEGEGGQIRGGYGGQHVLKLIYKHLYFQNLPGCDTRTPFKRGWGRRVERGRRKKSGVTVGVLERPHRMYIVARANLHQAYFMQLYIISRTLIAMQLVNLSREKQLYRKLVGVI